MQSGGLWGLNCIPLDLLGKKNSDQGDGQKAFEALFILHVLCKRLQGQQERSRQEQEQHQEEHKLREFKQKEK